MTESRRLSAFETHSVRMLRFWTVTIQGPAEDIARIMEHVTAVTPLRQGPYDNNAYATAAGTERYRPLDGAAAGADRGRGHRGDSLRGGIGAGERACVAGAAAGRDPRTQSGGGTDKGGRHRSERCCIGGVEAPCDVLERAIANQINSDDGWLHFAPVISLSK